MNYGIYNPNYGFPDSLSFGMKRLFAARPHPCYGLYLSLDSQTSKTRDIRLAVPLGIFLLENTEKSSDQAELPALNTQNDFLEYELLVFFASANKYSAWESRKLKRKTYKEQIYSCKMAKISVL